MENKQNKDKEVIICPECEKKGLESKVYPGTLITTLMGFSGFYDEKGEYHSHNPNTVTRSYSCSNKHRFSKKIPNSCSCGWKQDV